MKKLLILLTTLISLLLLISCDWEKPFGDDYTPHGEYWIATSNINGTSMKYITKEKPSKPYFVPNLENSEEEKILISSSSSIELMNLDGSDRHTIIDSIGDVFNFSHDRTKMLFVKDGDIFMAKVDGTELQNLTNTPDVRENYPAFSPNGDEIAYSYSINEITHAFIVIKDLSTNENEIVYDYKVTDSQNEIRLKHLNFKNENLLFFIFELDKVISKIKGFQHEIHSINIFDSSHEILMKDKKIYGFFYNNITNKSIIESENVLLVNMENYQIEHEFPVTYDIDYNVREIFSNSGNYVAIDGRIYDVNSNSEIEDNFDSDITFNKDEDKVIGIAITY